MPIGWRVWDALLQGLAHEALGDPSAAAPYFRHAAERGYLLLPYLAKDRVLLPLALMGLARVEGDQETSGATGAMRLERLLALANDEDVDGVAHAAESSFMLPRDRGCGA